MSHLNQIRALTDEERLSAREAARRVIVRAAGQQPTRSQFASAGVSRFPPWFTRVIALLMLVVFIAAALPSLFRLFSAGRDYFLHGIEDTWQAAAVGVSTFLLAEFLVILSALAARVYFTGRGRYVFVLPVAGGLALALVGNWTITQPADLFGWLETVIPPGAVLVLALIGEKLVLDSIQARHAGEVAYQQALTAWQAATADPERSPRWVHAYANALKAALTEAAGRGTGATARRALLETLTVDDWRALVKREIAADEWYHEPDSQPAPAPDPPTVDQPEEGGRSGAGRPFGTTVPVLAAAAFTPMNGHVNGNGHGANGANSKM
jgi:hypothetical protein